MEKENCPKCNCVTYDENIFQSNVRKKGKKYCVECMKWVIPCEAGKGKEFLEGLKNGK
jgi:hypothetical protein